MRGNVLVRSATLAVTGLVTLGLLGGCAQQQEQGPAAPSPPPSPCLTGAPGQDCVGLTDGADNLTGDPAFDTVYRAIKAENDRVTQVPGARTVSVVYTLPVSSTPDQLSTELREELEGAHLLQRRANDPSSDLAGMPAIRIVIANLGGGARGWEPVIRRVVEMADPSTPSPVVGVAGLGQSLETVRAAMAELSRHRIPMVPTRLTADGISPAPGTDGVFRIAPPNSAQVAAAASFLTTACRPVLVQDNRIDDLYVRDLASNFPRLVQAAGARSARCAASAPSDLLPVAKYDSSLPNVEIALQQRIPDLCQRNPDTVYYGGRGENLRSFIAALGSRDVRSCPGPITVVTTDDGLGLAAAVRQEIATNAAPSLQNALRSGLRVVVTGLASPGEWAPGAADDPNLVALAGSCSRCRGTVFPDESLDNGNIIMGHDALLTLVRAVRGGVSQQNVDVSAGTVFQALYGFGASRPVAGAGGPIGFDAEGKPIAKTIPILTVDERGTIAYQGST